jgi:hypothetical protein
MDTGCRADVHTVTANGLAIDGPSSQPNAIRCSPTARHLGIATRPMTMAFSVSAAGRREQRRCALFAGGAGSSTRTGDFAAVIALLRTARPISARRSWPERRR